MSHLSHGDAAPSPRIFRVPRRRRRGSTLVASLVVSFAIASPAPAQPATDAPQVLAPIKVNADCPLVKTGEFRLREERFAPAVVADGDWLYIIGGGNALGGYLETIERFNVRTHVSEKWGELQNGRRWHRAVLVDRKIYVLGGSTGWRKGGGEDFDSSVEVVDLDTRRATAGPEMPDRRGHFGCVAHNGKIYVIGGTHESSLAQRATNTMHVLDLATQRWSEGPTMPTARGGVAALVTGFILVPGGYNGARALPTVELFNPREQTWRTLPPLGQAVSGHSLVFLDRYLFLFGDFDRLDQITAYDLKDRSTAVYQLNYSSARHTAAVVHEGRIYIVGGKLAVPSALDLIQVFELRKKTVASQTP